MDIRFSPMKDDYLQKASEIYNHYIIDTTVTFHTEPLTTEDMKEILYQDDSLYTLFRSISALLFLTGTNYAATLIWRPIKSVRPTGFPPR